MLTRRVWLKVAQKNMRASGASFCHMGVCTKPERGARLRDAWICRILTVLLIGGWDYKIMSCNATAALYGNRIELWAWQATRVIMYISFALSMHGLHWSPVPFMPV